MNPVAPWVVAFLAGAATTAAVLWLLARARRSRADASLLEQATAIAMKIVARQFESAPDGMLMIGYKPLHVTINQKLIRVLQLPLETAAGDSAAILAAVLARVREPDRLRADIALLEGKPETLIHHDIELADGAMFELHAGTMLQPSSAGQSLMSFFVFHGIADRIRTERELQFANTLLLTQIEALPLAALVVDEAGNVSSFNSRFANLDPSSSLQRGAAVAPLQKAFAGLIEDPVPFLARVNYLVAHPDEDSVDEFAMKDGRVMSRHCVRLRAPDGSVLGRVWYFDDITAVRNATRVLEDERNFATALLDSLPGYFVLIDSAGRLIRWNESLRLLNGLSNEDILGSDPFANVVESDRAITMSKLRETLVEGFAELEFGIHTSSRGIRAIRWHGRRIMVHGEAQVLAVGIDVTDIRAAEAQLRASEDRFRGIFEAVTDGILAQDITTGLYLDVNPRACEMFGYTRDEFLTIHSAELSAESKEDTVAKVAAMRASDPAKTDVFEWRCRRKDGTEFWTEVSSRRMTFGGRGVILSIIRDTTVRRQAIAEVTYRDRILHALTLSTAELVKTTSLAISMPLLLQAVGEELAVDRLLVVRPASTERDPNGVEIAYGWQREGVKHVVPGSVAELKRDPASSAAFRAWFAPLRDGKPVVTQLETATGLVRLILLDGNTRSNLRLPIFVGGMYWGHFAVDDTRVARVWTPVEIDALATLAGVVAALLTRERSADRLQESEEQFRTVSETVLDAIIMIDLDGRVRFWNHSAERIFGYSADEARGKSIHDWLTPPRYRAEAKAGMAGFVATGHGALLGKTVELPATRKDGVEIEVELSINAMTVGPSRYAVGIARDITERKRATVLIEQMASHDELTGLPNRRRFIESLEASIGRARRSGRLFAVLYLDLDRFKDVNDTLGHPVGDLLLRAVAERLLANVRDVDTVARFGGDEFAAIQTDIREPADAAVLAANLAQALGQPFAIGANEIHSGTSIGIALYGPDSPDAEALLAHADVALYRAKAEGRGTYRFYTEAMDAEVRSRVALENDLREGLAAQQFFLLYQPQVDVDERIVGLEVLVRWNHPERGVVEPAAFIPAAEKSGLIGALGLWVLREACRQTKTWLDAGITPPRIAVNVSALQFKAPLDFEKSLTATVDEAGLTLNMLELEVTESTIMEASQQHNEVLLRLRGRGMSLAIDDFGSGFSSLDYLRRFPVDRIKIPQNFIADLGVVSDRAPIVRATIGLARELGITVLAEGVETATQFVLLKRWGCQEMQGFYFAKPLPPAEIAVLLRTGIAHKGVPS
jgi:diguanylate cyclase (GGDEF)-like protein/PAS domain S-box-containing protein